ncbi:MAG: chromosomal replication initiator protein DnaA [Deltaproteobacteria bacterium HGW-Deltaproteobacteria-19]|nr:MAG: chromosomal replication initiator protein DnaA [Deltaproteobacteria bacterium HGW-Deltaproteobacteria-19]
MDIIWEKATNIIRKQVSQQNFETWIQPVRVTAIEGNSVQFTVPNKFFKDWLNDNYLPIIKESLKEVSGIDLSVHFSVSKGDGRAAETQTEAKKSEGKSVRKSPVTKYDSNLNPNYSFERFVVGSCNQFAHAAAVSVGEMPAKNYNPLFIYSDVGLGKTHLLNAIGLHTLNLYPDTNVVYVSAEEFVNELISSIRYDRTAKFREKYRKIDCLLIDDIQFIAGKDRTQEEFFHTFNTLHDAGKQIVVTSDKFPKDIPNLEDRLRSRFEWGLIADIHPPDIETRIAILEKKAQDNNIQLPSGVSHYVASNAQSNIRELEGFLVRISAYSSVTGRSIDMELAREVLRKIIRQNEREDITVDEIVRAASGKFNVKLSDLKSKKKSKNIVLARQSAMFLCRRLTNASFPDIGEKIGGRDHSTVIYSVNKISALIEKDANLKKTIQDIEDALQQSS